MQKIRKSYWIVFENMHGGPGPVIYGTTTRTGQGPYPALPDNECKNSDHLESLVAPLRATCFWLLVPIISLLRICCAFRAHADQSILAVPFGHSQYNAPLSRSETYFFHKMEDFNTLGRRSDCRVNLVFFVWAFCGVKPHKKGPQFYRKFRIKILCLKSRKLYFSILGPKTVQIDVFWSQKYGILVFLTKNQF